MFSLSRYVGLGSLVPKLSVHPIMLIIFHSADPLALARSATAFICCGFWDMLNSLKHGQTLSLGVRVSDSNP